MVVTDRFHCTMVEAVSLRCQIFGSHCLCRVVGSLSSMLNDSIYPCQVSRNDRINATLCCYFHQIFRHIYNQNVLFSNWNIYFLSFLSVSFNKFATGKVHKKDRWNRRRGAHPHDIIIGHVTLVAITGTNVLMRCLWIKPLQCMWRSGTRCSDLATCGLFH